MSAMSLSACAEVLPLRVLITVLLLQNTPCGIPRGVLSMTVVIPAQSRVELFSDTGASQPSHAEKLNVSTPAPSNEPDEESPSPQNSTTGSNAAHAGMIPDRFLSWKRFMAC